jgi:hypothetical protein
MRPADRVRLDRLARRAHGVTLASLVALATCRFEVGSAEVASSAPPPAMTVDTLRAGCPEPLPALAVSTPIALGVEAKRLLPAGDGLLVVAEEGGLHRYSARRTERLLQGGRDYALYGRRLIRLEGNRIEIFDYSGAAGVPALRSRLPAQGHDVSVLLLKPGAFVHSAFNEHALVLRRSVRDGAVEAAMLPVERDLLRSLLLGPERLHRDEGLLAGEGKWLLHVPFVRDPVQAIDTEASHRWVLMLAHGRRGKVRIEGEERREVQACSACIRRVEMRARVTFVPLYAGAAVDDGVFWILRLDPAGGSRAALLRVAPEMAEIRAWRVAFPTRPGALAVWRDSLAIAAGLQLWFLWRWRRGSPGAGR